MDWVRDIVLNMHGQDLTALKNAMDDGGDAHNIHKLIYNDILVCASRAMYQGLLFVCVTDSMRTDIADYCIRAVTHCLMQRSIACCPCLCGRWREQLSVVMYFVHQCQDTVGRIPPTQYTGFVNT